MRIQFHSMIPSFLLLSIAIAMLAGCAHHEGDHDHDTETAGPEPLSYTLYTDRTELFVEFKPLVVGSESRLAVHFTVLGERFLPLKRGNITVSLEIDGKRESQQVDTASAPGIFRMALSPITAGTGQLVFDIRTESYTDRIVIEGIEVYTDEAAAVADAADEMGNGNTVAYLKEQAWKIDFANGPVVRQPFNNIIRTSGELLPAPGDEMVLTAKGHGIVLFAGSGSIVGSEVKAGEALFTISGSDLTENNMDAAYSEAKANLTKAQADLDRSTELIRDRIVSQKEHLEVQRNFENARTAFNTLAKNYGNKGLTVTSPISGYIKNALVSEGQFVESGTELATVSKNRKLLLQSHVSQRHFDQLSTIRSANFKTSGTKEVWNTEALNGRVVAYGKSATPDSPFIPVTFEIDNMGNLVAGSVVEVYLRSTAITDALVIPMSSLMEEQGSFFVYVQSGGESFEKRELKLGASDGMRVQVLAGVEEGERVVTKGAYQIKLASASGTLPAHGHEH